MIDYILYLALISIEMVVNWLIIWTGMMDDKYQITITTRYDEYIIHPKELL